MNPFVGSGRYLVLSRQEEILADVRTDLLVREARARSNRRSSRLPVGRSAGQAWAAITARIRPDHSFTAYPCRLPSGEMGRVAAVLVDGEWALVCKAAN